MNEKTYFKKKQLEQGRTFSLVGKWSRLHINSWTRQCLPLYIYIYRYIYATPPIVFRSLLFFSYLWGESFLFFFGGGGDESVGQSWEQEEREEGRGLRWRGMERGKKPQKRDAWMRYFRAPFWSSETGSASRGHSMWLHILGANRDTLQISFSCFVQIFFFDTSTPKLTSSQQHTQRIETRFFFRGSTNNEKKKKKPGDHLFRIASVPFWKKKHTHTQISHKNKEMRQKWEFGRGVKRKAKKPIAKPPPPDSPQTEQCITPLPCKIPKQFSPWMQNFNRQTLLRAFSDTMFQIYFPL